MLYLLLQTNLSFDRKNFTFVKIPSIVDEIWELLKFLSVEYQKNLALLKYQKRLISRTIFHPDGVSMGSGEKEVETFRYLFFHRFLAFGHTFQAINFVVFLKKLE
jgi:hypothetical protein